MDEMRLNLSSRFMKNIASKLLSKVIYKKTGYKVKILLDELDTWVIDGDTTIKVSLEARLNSDDFNKLMKSIVKDEA